MKPVVSFIGYDDLEDREEQLVAEACSEGDVDWEPTYVRPESMVD